MILTIIQSSVFAAFTGLRKGELHALKWREVNLISRTVLVKYSMDRFDSIKTTKTNRIRYVYLSNEMASILSSLKGDSKESDFVFQSQGGGHFKFNRLSKVVSRNAKRCGLKHITLHSLRHTCASAIANADGIVFAQQALGHSDVKTTMGYYHSDREALRDAMTRQFHVSSHLKKHQSHTSKIHIKTREGKMN